LSLRNGIAIAFLASAAAASYWWSREPPAEPAKRRADDSTLPGYYAHGARLTGTDDAGRVAYRLRADSLEEVPGEGRFAMSGVRVEYTPADETPWSITALRASAPTNGSELDFEGEVELRSAPADSRHAYVLTTPQLRFEPDRSWVETDQRVDVRVGDWQVAGVGLRAHLNDETLKLESGVHGRIVP
jgi:LPS export ABC transporter protein LptC